MYDTILDRQIFDEYINLLKNNHVKKLWKKLSSEVEGLPLAICQERSNSTSSSCALIWHYSDFFLEIIITADGNIYWYHNDYDDSEQTLTSVKCDSDKKDGYTVDGLIPFLKLAVAASIMEK